MVQVRLSRTVTVEKKRQEWKAQLDHIYVVVGDEIAKCKLARNQCARSLGSPIMIRDRHPVATTIVNALENDTVSPCLGAASRAAQDLDGVEEFGSRNGEHWQLVRPPPREPEGSNLGARELVGNTKHPAELNASSEEAKC